MREKKERDGGRRRRDTWTHDVTGVVYLRVDLLREFVAHLLHFWLLSKTNL